jgi:hypothetical protein
VAAAAGIAPVAARRGGQARVRIAIRPCAGTCLERSPLAVLAGTRAASPAGRRDAGRNTPRRRLRDTRRAGYDADWNWHGTDDSRGACRGRDLLPLNTGRPGTNRGSGREIGPSAPGSGSVEGHTGRSHRTYGAHSALPCRGRAVGRHHRPPARGEAARARQPLTTARDPPPHWAGSRVNREASARDRHTVTAANRRHRRRAPAALCHPAPVPARFQPHPLLAGWPACRPRSAAEALRWSQPLSVDLVG